MRKQQEITAPILDGEDWPPEHYEDLVRRVIERKGVQWTLDFIDELIELELEGVERAH